MKEKKLSDKLGIWYERDDMETTHFPVWIMIPISDTVTMYGRECKCSKCGNNHTERIFEARNVLEEGKGT